MFFLKFYINHPSAVKAWAIFLILMAVSATINTTQAEPAFTLVEDIFSFVSSAVCAGFVFYCLVNMHGGIKRSRKAPYHEMSIGIWGYFWRGFLIFYLSFACILFIAFIFNLKNAKVEFFVLFITTSILNFLFIPLITWIFFSKDRKGQINWVLSFLRGY